MQCLKYESENLEKQVYAQYFILQATGIANTRLQAKRNYKLQAWIISQEEAMPCETAIKLKCLVQELCYRNGSSLVF